jgi:hypothetical protein
MGGVHPPGIDPLIGTALHPGAMSGGAKEIIEAALKLDPGEREQIAGALWDSLEHGDDEASAETRPERLSDREVKRSVSRFIAEFSATDPGTSAVRDLTDGRR